MLKRCILPDIAFLLFRYINIPLNANNAKMNRLNALYGIMRIHNANITEKRKTMYDVFPHAHTQMD